MRSFYDRCLVVCALIMTVSPVYAQVPQVAPTPSGASSPSLLASNVRALTPAQIATMATIQVSQISPSDIATLTPAQLAAFTASQLQVFTNAQILALTSAQILNMHYGQMISMSQAQLTVLGQNPNAVAVGAAVAAAAVTQTSTASGPSLANLKMSTVTPAQLAAYTPSQIATIAPSEITALTNDQLAVLTTAQIQALTSTQLISLTFAQVVNFTLVQISSLSPAQMNVVQASPSFVAGSQQFTAANAPPPPVSPYKPVMFQGVDVAPFIEFAKSDLRKVTAPFNLYHWDQGGQNAYWNTIKSGHDAAFARSIARAADNPFRALGRPGGSNNMYGGGFYTSLDPVATRTYGGYSYYGSQTNTPFQMWQLTQITVPVGTVFLDLNTAHSFSASKFDLQPILTHFACTASSADDFFRSGGAYMKSTCVDLVRFVYEKTLQIDMFSYSYSTTSFTTCENGLSKNSSDRQRAIVLANGRWITPQGVLVLHSGSTDELETRRLIQTLFSISNYANSYGQTFSPQMAKSTIVNLLTQYPGSSIQAGTVQCSGSRCSMPIYACPRGTKWNAAGAQCYSSTMSLPAPKNDTFHKTDFSDGLLWPDLDGQKKATSDQVDKYLNSNRLGCDGTPRYVKVPTDALQAGY